MQLLNISATIILPSLSQARRMGILNLALLPSPSEKPNSPFPARETIATSACIPVAIKRKSRKKNIPDFKIFINPPFLLILIY